MDTSETRYHGTGGALRRWLARGGSIGFIVGLVAIVAIRTTAHTSDFAMANALTALLIVLSWLMLAMALAASPWRRFWWRAALLGPIAFLLMFFGMYKFERFNGEMSPQFAWRWGSQTPSSNGSPTQDAVPSELIAPRDSDFPQYLGKNRDAILRDTSIDPHWNISSPRIAWKQAVGEGWSGFAVQGDVAITMEQRGEQEWIVAYRLLDGGLLWKATIESKHGNVLGGTGPRSTPTIFDGRVYACSAVSRVVCLELTTGIEIWGKDLLELSGTNQSDFEKEVSWGRSASPLVFSEQVVVPLGGVGDRKNTLIAFDRTTGDELWRGGNDQISYASPSVAELSGQRQILYVSESQCSGYDINTGQPLWTSAWPGSSNGSASVSQPIVIDGSSVLLSKGYGVGTRLLEVNRSDENWNVRIVWSNESSLRTKFTNCVVDNDFVYGLSDGILECVRWKDGLRQWKKGRYRQGQLLLVGKHLLITAENGQLVLVDADPAKFNEVASFDVIGDVTWNTAALSGNRLLMRNSDEAACVILPLISAPSHAVLLRH